MGKKDEIKFEGRMVRSDVIQALNDLLRTFEEGSVRLEAEGRQLVLTPGAIMTLKVEGTSRSDKQQLEIKLTWDPTEVADLRISSNGNESGTSPFGG